LNLSYFEFILYEVIQRPNCRDFLKLTSIFICAVHITPRGLVQLPSDARLPKRKLVGPFSGDHKTNARPIFMNPFIVWFVLPQPGSND